MTISDIKGKTFEDAKKILDEAGVKWRLVSKDDKPFIVTADYRPDRYNLSVVDDIVVAVTFG